MGADLIRIREGRWLTGEFFGRAFDIAPAHVASTHGSASVSRREGKVTPV